MTESPQSFVEGVYLCDTLDLDALFSETMRTVEGLRLYRPEDVPDPARITMALAYRPSTGSFARFPHLRLVQSIAAGVDGILADPSLPKDVPVARIRDTEQAAIMAGFAVWHVVWHHRTMRHYIECAREARWDRISFDGVRAPSKTIVGILGFGTMGQTVAKAVQTLGFDVKVAATRPHPTPPGVELVAGPDAALAVAAQSHILINLLPLTDATRGFMDAAFLASMPKGAALVHLGRGEHLDEAALLAALDTGHLSGASVDVFAMEPLPEDHPFWRHPKVMVTPHEASVLPASAVATALCHSLADINAGRPPRTAVDKTKGY